MTNPTSNYNFQMPTATDLVTDLPADFEVFGQAVDTRLKALQPGTTLGDLAYSSATANTNTRLGIGTTGQILTVAGGVPTWGAAPTSGGMTLLSTTTLSGTQTSVTGISGAYKNLYVTIDDFYTATAGSVYIRVNSLTTSIYRGGALTTEGFDSSPAASNQIINGTQTSIGANDFAAADNDNFCFFTIYDYANANNSKLIQGMAKGRKTAGDYFLNMFNFFVGKTAIAAIDSIQIRADYAFSAGTLKIYGVN